MIYKYKIYFISCISIFIVLFYSLSYLNRDLNYTCFITTDDLGVVNTFYFLEFDSFKDERVKTYNAKISLKENDIEKFKYRLNKNNINNYNYKFYCKKNKLDSMEITLISIIITLFFSYELFLFRIK